MFPEMRRKRQQLSGTDAEEVLRQGSYGVLALLGNEGWPYALPINYLYSQGKLYFHCAAQGHKLEAIAHEPRASFCVVDRDEVVPEKLTTAYRSVIAFGRIRRLEDRGEMAAVLKALGERFAPGKDVTEETERYISNMAVLEMEIEHLSGKEGMELIRRRDSREN